MANLRQGGLLFGIGGGGSTAAIDSEGFLELLKSAGEEYGPIDRTAAEQAVFESFDRGFTHEEPVGAITSVVFERYRTTRYFTFIDNVTSPAAVSQNHTVIAYSTAQGDSVTPEFTLTFTFHENGGNGWRVILEVDGTTNISLVDNETARTTTITIGVNATLENTIAYINANSSFVDASYVITDDMDADDVPGGTWGTSIGDHAPITLTLTGASGSGGDITFDTATDTNTALEQLDNSDDESFPFRILVKKESAGNFVLTRSARFKQGDADSGSTNISFAAGQIREVIITKESGTLRGSIYNVEFVDGISAQTVIEQDVTYRGLAYLFNHYFEVAAGGTAAQATSFPVVAKYHINPNQQFSAGENTWRTLAFNAVPAEEQHNAGADISARSNAITVKPGTYNVKVSATVVDENNNRRYLAFRLLDSNSHVLADYTRTTYYRGVAGFDDAGRISDHFTSIIISAETTFNVQSAAVSREDAPATSALNIWASTPGGVIEITKIAVGGRGDPGPRGDDGDDAAVNTDSTLTGTGATGTPLGVADGGVDTAQLADQAVDATKIAPDAVARGKIADAAVNTARLADNAVETAKINAKAVTLAKMADGTAGRGLRFNTTTGVIEEAEWPSGGSSGTATSAWKGPWAAGVFAAGDLVTYSGIIYMANAARAATDTTTPDADPVWVQITNDTVFRGNWQDQDYERGQIVVYQARLWIARVNVSTGDGAPAQDSVQWRRIDTNMNFRGPYDASFRYSYGEMVTLNSRFWICNVASIEPNAATGPRVSSDWLEFGGGGGTSTPVINETGFANLASAAGDEYTADDRDTAEVAVWNSFGGLTSPGGTIITFNELAAARGTRRMQLTDTQPVGLSASQAQQDLDTITDSDLFPIKILVQRAVAGNLNITRGTRFRQGGQTSGTKSYEFTADQVRELIITRISGTGNTSIYNVDVIDGISAGTMIEKVRLASTGFRVIAYLFDRYFNTFRGEWSPDGIYQKSETVSNNGRLFVALIGTGPSDIPPLDSTAWRPIDNNMSYRGDYINSGAHYRQGDTVRDNGRLFMLIAVSLVSDSDDPRPGGDPTNWFPVSVPEATEEEVTAGTVASKFLSPLALQTKLDALPAPGGSTILDMDSRNIVRLEADGQTITAASTTRQINKGDVERKEVQLTGVTSANIRLVVSIQGSDAAHWGGVNFVVANGTDKPIDAYAIATGAGNGSPISGTDITNIPAGRRAIVRISESSTATLSAQGLTLAVDLIDGAAGSVDYATETEAKALALTNKVLAPINLAQVVAAWARANGVAGAGKMPIGQVERAYEHADDAGDIVQVFGFDLMGFLFTKRTDIGHGNEAWRFVRFDDIFELVSQTIGTDPNTRQFNYGLRFKSNVIHYNHITDLLDLDNLLGIVFPQYASGTVATGNALIPRPVGPTSVSWIAGDDALLNNTFTKSGSEVKITIGNKRNAASRGITHLLVRVGRVAGIDATSSRSDIINATRPDSVVYYEAHIPITVVQGHGGPSVPAFSTGQEYSNYGIAFANGNEASCVLQVEHTISSGQGAITAKAHHGSSTTGFNGTEFLAFYVVRGIGG